MNEDNYTGFKKRLSAVDIYTYELLCLHYIFLSLILFAVIHGYHNRRDLSCPPKVNAYRAFSSPIKYQLSRSVFSERLRRDGEHVSSLKETWWRAPSL